MLAKFTSFTFEHWNDMEAMCWDSDAVADGDDEDDMVQSMLLAAACDIVEVRGARLHGCGGCMCAAHACLNAHAVTGFKPPPPKPTTIAPAGCCQGARRARVGGSRFGAARGGR